MFAIGSPLTRGRVVLDPTTCKQVSFGPKDHVIGLARLDKHDLQLLGLRSVRRRIEYFHESKEFQEFHMCIERYSVSSFGFVIDSRPNQFVW